MKKLKADVVIIGGGLTGLASAFFLKEAGRSVLLLEKKNRLGGAITTVAENGFMYECGPNTGTVSSIEMQKLLDAVADICNPVYANREAAKRYILKDRKWQALPSGLLSGLKTPLFTFADKLRILGEPFRKAGNQPEESVADLVRRRMGKSFLDYAVNPFISGIYAGDPEKLVTKYALRRLYDLEQKYGSFFKGSMQKAKEDKKNKIEKPSKLVFSTDQGLGGLIDAVSQKIGEESFFTDAQNIRVEPLQKGFMTRAFINAEHYEVESKQVLTAVPSSALSDILPFASDGILQDLGNLHYAQVAELIMGWNKWDGMPLDGFGGLIPQKEERSLLGILFMSAIFPGRCPEGGALLTGFLGGDIHPEWADIDDDSLYRLMEYEMPILMGLKDFRPDFFKVIRHKEAIPQYYANTKARLRAVETIQEQFTGLIVGGNLRDGIGMHDRVKQAKYLTEKILEMA